MKIIRTMMCQKKQTWKPHFISISGSTARKEMKVKKLRNEIEFELCPLFKRTIKKESPADDDGRMREREIKRGHVKMNIKHNWRHDDTWNTHPRSMWRRIDPSLRKILSRKQFLFRVITSVWHFTGAKKDTNHVLHFQIYKKNRVERGGKKRRLKQALAFSTPRCARTPTLKATGALCS